MRKQLDKFTMWNSSTRQLSWTLQKVNVTGKKSVGEQSLLFLFFFFSFFFFFGHTGTACRILVPPPEIEPVPREMEV